MLSEETATVDSKFAELQQRLVDVVVRYRRELGAFFEVSLILAVVAAVSTCWQCSRELLGLSLIEPPNHCHMVKPSGIGGRRLLVAMHAAVS